MKKIVFLLLAVALLAAKDNPDAKKPKPRFPLGKETTFVTEPLDADGYIDYTAALNERLRRGVTPENNAVVMLWKALGPRPNGRKVSDAYFKWLGIGPPPERGDYLVPIWPHFLRKTDQDEFSRCTQRPWKAPEHPNIAARLKANEKPLALVVEASRRPHYFSPLIPRKSDKGSSGLVYAPTPILDLPRELAVMLTTRAMLRLGEGRFEDAWLDLLACHRLGRLVGRGAAHIDLLIGMAIDAIAAKGDLALLESVDWKAEQIIRRLRELRKLPPMPLAADKVDLGERFMLLDVYEILDRYGPDGLDDGSGAASNSIANMVSRAAINYEPSLRIINRWCDRIVKAMRTEDRETREAQLDQIGKKLDELVKKSSESTPGIFQIRKAKGRHLGYLMMGLTAPGLHKAQQSCDRCEQVQNNLYVAFALAAYHRDHGSYPKQLAALAPKYLDKIPTDLFSGKPLIYRPSDNGYLLYSVGVNGQDEKGHSLDGQPQPDDITIRMPLPKVKHK